MDNYSLLNKYRKKLSIYFALFILFSFWWTQFIYQWVKFYSNKVRLENNLEKKLTGIKNIIRNKEWYDLKLQQNDKIFKKILKKTLENTVIYNNWELAISFIEWFDTKKLVYKNKRYFDLDWYKYFKTVFNYGWNKYDIFIRIKNDFTFYNFIKDFLFFIIFSLPFFVIFYFIWYFFVWKNLKPISQTISSLEDFTANINHEIKTPLSEIISSLSLANKTWEYKEAVNISINSANKINKIVESMLWIVNIIDSSYKREKINIWLEIEKIIDDNLYYKREKNIKIIKNINDKNFYLKINKEHLNICISNIYKNSVKYTNKWWVVEISFDKWILLIKDNWVWIDKNNLKHIFWRFFREDYIYEEWTWIWLSLVKKIVDMNKWTINILSKKWKWTVVEIKFV